MVTCFYRYYCELPSMPGMRFIHRDLYLYQMSSVGLKTHYLTLGFNVISFIHIQQITQRITSHLWCEMQFFPWVLTLTLSQPNKNTKEVEVKVSPMENYTCSSSFNLWFPQLLAPGFDIILGCLYLRSNSPSKYVTFKTRVTKEFLFPEKELLGFLGFSSPKK